MAEPKEIAESILKLSKRKQLARLTNILEMVRCAIVIRSACRDRMFVSLTGKEDAGTKFDRLLEEEFGLTWKEK